MIENIKQISRSMQQRYALDDLRRGLEDPHRAVSELNRVYNHSRAGRPYNASGADIFAEDWDTLVILDACRYDAFRHQSSLPGRTEYRISRGSTSSEFIRGNFTNKTLYDTAYVSANGWYAKLEDKLGAAVHTFDFVERDAMDGLTSRPETVADAARDAVETYPNKKLIIHFMQPHQPYLGPLGDKFDFSGDMMDTIRHSEVERKDVLLAYRENLNLVFETVESLLTDLQGKTVITADHGELLGEQERPIPVRSYGHPEGIYVEELVKVPWHIYENGDRRHVVAEQPTTESDDVDFKQVEQNLRDLGYRT